MRATHPALLRLAATGAGAGEIPNEIEAARRPGLQHPFARGSRPDRGGRALRRESPRENAWADGRATGRGLGDRGSAGRVPELSACRNTVPGAIATGAAR